MRRFFIYKAVINRSTEAKCLKWLFLCRHLYNCALEERIEAYRSRRVSLTGYSQMAELPALKEALPEYKEVGSQCLQDVIDRLDRAYKAFFRRVKSGDTPGFPRFKGRDRYDSFTLKQTGWKLEGRYLYIRNVGLARRKQRGGGMALAAGFKAQIHLSAFPVKLFIRIGQETAQAFTW